MEIKALKSNSEIRENVTGQQEKVQHTKEFE